MIRLLCVLLAAVLVAAVVSVVHRSTAGVPGRSPAVVSVVGGSSKPPSGVDRSPRSRTRRPHHRHLAAVTTRLLDTTAYCETSNRTASGVWPRYGMAASNLFPFGTRLRVPGWPVVVTVTDRIGWGSQLDLFAGTAPGCEHRALTWGRRELLVEVLNGR